MGLSKRLRFEILRRDNHACRYCGAQASIGKMLTIDHVLPVALGGQDVPENLVAACADCNSGKAATNPDAPLVADVSAKALQWQQAISLAVSLAGRDSEVAETAFNQVIEVWQSSFGPAAPPPIDADGLNTVRKWIARGLDVNTLIRLVGVTAAKYQRDRTLWWDRCWSFYAGCCWSALSDLEDAAQKLIEAGEV